jgi:secretion/DNA translocation related CpaE-like protein
MTGKDSSALARVIVVVGARGGAGASSLAVAIAQSSAQEGKQTVLLDADELGGGIDLVLGAEGHRGVRWSELAAVDAELPSQALFDALAVHRGVRFLSCSREGDSSISPDLMIRVIHALRESCDLVVLDSPRRDDCLLAVLATVQCEVLIVVPNEVRSVAAASAWLSRCAGLTVPIRSVVVELPTGGLSARATRKPLGIPSAGTIRYCLTTAQELDRGSGMRSGKNPWASVCSSALDHDMVRVTG